jgi:hypothetical protein
MSSSLRIKPFGLSEDGGCIDDFDDTEMDEILDLFESLAEKCRDTFNNLNDVSVELDPKEKGVIVIDYTLKDGNDLSDDDFLFYVESLTGYNSNNIIEIGDVDYAIMGEPIEETPAPIEQEQKKVKSKSSNQKAQDFLDKMTKLEKAVKYK